MYILTEQSAHCDIDKVVSRDLGDEGKAARGTRIAFDHEDVILFGKELDIEGAGDIKFTDDLLRRCFGAADCLEIGALRWQYHRGIARVSARVLHVFGDRIDDELALCRHAVDLDLARILDEFRDDHRVVRRYIGCAFEEFRQ